MNLNDIGGEAITLDQEKLLESDEKEKTPSSKESEVILATITLKMVELK